MYWFDKPQNELEDHEKKWSHMKYVLLSGKSKSEKALYCTVPTVCHSGKPNTMESVKTSVVAEKASTRKTRDDWMEH